MFMSDDKIIATFPETFWNGYNDYRIGRDSHRDYSVHTFEQKAYKLGQKEAIKDDKRESRYA